MFKSPQEPVLAAVAAQGRFQDLHGRASSKEQPAC